MDITLGHLKINTSKEPGKMFGSGPAIVALVKAGEEDS